MHTDHHRWTREQTWSHSLPHRFSVLICGRPEGGIPADWLHPTHRLPTFGKRVMLGVLEAVSQDGYVSPLTVQPATLAHCALHPQRSRGEPTRESPALGCRRTGKPCLACDIPAHMHAKASSAQKHQAAALRCTWYRLYELYLPSILFATALARFVSPLKPRRTARPCISCEKIGTITSVTKYRRKAHARTQGDCSCVQYGPRCPP